MSLFGDAIDFVGNIYHDVRSVVITPQKIVNKIAGKKTTQTIGKITSPISGNTNPAIIQYAFQRAITKINEDNKMATTGDNWFQKNILNNPTRLANTVDIQVAAEDPTSIRIIDKVGSGKLNVGSSQTANEIVTAWKAYSGQAGASKPTDPISASVTNLVNGALNATAGASPDGGTVQSAINSVSTKTGLPTWIVIIGLALAAIWIVPKMFRFIKRKLRR